MVLGSISGINGATNNVNVGIGTTTPKARLHISDSAVLFTGPANLPVNASNPPVSGAGTRTMWYPDRAAFRTGSVDGGQWNKDSLGYYSFSSGFATKASGYASTSIGLRTTATGTYSISMGDRSIASGESSTSMGRESIASGAYSTSMGALTVAKANSALTIGVCNDNTDNPSGLFFGSTDRIFQIGNGTADNARSNALTVLRNGNVGIGILNPTRPLSFPAALGEKILLYPGGLGEVGIGVYGNELRLHADNPGSSVTFGTQDNAGTFTQSGRFQLNGGYGLFVNGNIWANGTTYASDARFKQNITPIESPLEKIMQIDGVQYEMNVDDFSQNNFIPGKQIGLLAQNVEKVVPEAVHEVDGYKGVDYAKLVPLLVESIKAQQKQIDELKKQIEQLSKK